MFVVFAECVVCYIFSIKSKIALRMDLVKNDLRFLSKGGNTTTMNSSNCKHTPKMWHI